jgi:hypothetical protein
VKKAAARGWNASRIQARTHAGPKNLKALWLAVFLVTASGLPPRTRAESNSTSEYDVKAAFLFHFAQFVEWPAEAFDDADSPLTYCTIGEDAFRGALDESVKGKRVGNRELRVRHLKERERIEGCQVLFIAAAQRARQGEELANASGRPVLTVGETEHFARDGGIIGFCLEQKKVRFEINLIAAEQAQLKISAKLLSLAKTVLGNPRGD